MSTKQVTPPAFNLVLDAQAIRQAFDKGETERKTELGTVDGLTKYVKSLGRSHATQQAGTAVRAILAPSDRTPGPVPPPKQ